MSHHNKKTPSKKHYQASPKCLKTDNGTEYIMNEFKEFCCENVIF